MRKIIPFNEDWSFKKDGEVQVVTIPHTWNAIDGQDGGNDYARGEFVYEKHWFVETLPTDRELWIEFRAVGQSARVYCNHQLVGSHQGGYSTFRCQLTDVLQVGNNVLEVYVDNRYSREVYPQKADFTFYGGIYRDVYLLEVPKLHFSLDQDGGPGVELTVQTKQEVAKITINTHLSQQEGSVRYRVKNQEGLVVYETVVHTTEGNHQITIDLPEVHLWNGLEDPYLYQLEAMIVESGDVVELPFGCREMSFDSQRGFFLNGVSYPLVGVAKHQDFEGVGNAISKKMMEEDMQLILEMGANTIRAAHYQHDDYFYVLADRLGLIIWAEIPYITEHMDEGYHNSLQQMRELIQQNRHHPSIVCWALSNEITATTGVSESLMRNHEALQSLCHELDPSRPTTMAHVFMLDPVSPLVQLPDIRSYNLYYGWYLGEMEDNDRWFDRFHEQYPTTVIGLSEFGADANPAYHSVSPEKGDYSEEYQALYHEHMLAMWKKRPYIWAMHVWNMFDFGADGRKEGGKPGQNQKGLVTFDRRIKKDAYYIYKAYLAKEPFVHLCGKRFNKRPQEETVIKVYSNLKEITLFVDGHEVGTMKGEYVFEFPVHLTGQHHVEAVSGDYHDSMVVERVEELPEQYICPGREVKNWFDHPKMEIKEGYYSIQDSVEELLLHPEAAAIFESVMARVKAAYGEVAQQIEIPEEMQKMMNRAPFEKLLQQSGNIVSDEEVRQIHQQLTKIPKKGVEK